MSRRSSIACATAIAAVALIARPAAAEPCTAAAKVSGPAELVTPVVALLRERGVDVTDGADGASCAAVTAEVARRADERVVVTAVDADGRQFERVADDVEAVATAIEAWARRDLTEPLLAARSVRERPQLNDREAPPAVTIEDESAEPPPYRPALWLAAGVQSGLGSDGSVWNGARILGCYPIGAACIGGLVQYAYDTRRPGGSAVPSTEREVVGIYATIAVPLRRGRLALSPGAGIGPSWVLAELDIGEENDIGEVTSSPAARANVSASVRVKDAWCLHIDVAADFAPLARDVLGTAELPLAGAVKLQTWVGLGFGYGGP